MSLNVVMLGPPGAGKGTQAERLSKGFGIPKISTGDILRECAMSGSDLGRRIRTTMDGGQLVGDDIMIEIVRERLARPDAAPGFVLDGFPRTVVQAEALDAMVAGRGPLTVLHLVVPMDVLVDRLSARRICEGCGANAAPGAAADARCPACGGQYVQRRDDSTAVARERLAVFERQTRPLVEYYRTSPAFFEIDGHRSPDDVTAAMRRVVATATPVAASRPAVKEERA